MSEENVEMVRAGLDAYARGDWDIALRDAAPDFEFDMSRAIGPQRGGELGRDRPSLPFHATPAGPPFDGSVTALGSNGVAKGNFTGGGMTIPWGITVDGNDNVWVANFNGKRLTQICGHRVKACRPGGRAGSAISPPSGYGFDGLVRNTGVAIDPSGNVWLTNNFKTVPPPSNPGGYETGAFVGLGGPLKTPVIGTPRRP
jgi:hypothetical protein